MMKIDISVSGASNGAKSRAKKAIRRSIEKKVARKLPPNLSFRTVVHGNKVDVTVEINNKNMPKDGQYDITLEQSKITISNGKTLGLIDVSGVDTNFLYETLGNVAATVLMSFIPDEIKVMSNVKQAGFNI